MKSVLSCVVLGLLTLAGVYALNFVPASDGLSSFQDNALAPGALAASLMWPEGIHSNSPALFLGMFMAVNLVFYSLLWLVVLAALGEVRHLMGHRR